MHLVINGDEMTIHIYSDSYGQDCDTGRFRSGDAYAAVPPDIEKEHPLPDI